MRVPDLFDRAPDDAGDTHLPVAENLRFRRAVGGERGEVGEHVVDLRHGLLRALEHAHFEQLVELFDGVETRDGCEAGAAVCLLEDEGRAR